MSNIPSGIDIINEGISSHTSLKEASKHIAELIKFSCIDLALIRGEDWFLYPGRHYRNVYNPNHPFYELEEEKLKRYRIDFTREIEEKIEERRGEIFKNGLHKKQQEANIKIEILSLTESQLEKIKSGEIEWIMRFGVTQHLTPRYMKDGDKKEYTMIFEIHVSELGCNSHVLKNHAVLNTGNRQYKIGITSPRKISPETEGRDELIQRAREDYRRRLINVLRLERNRWQKK